jgi:hypothetical protein
VYGYIIWSDKRFEEAMVRQRNVALLAGSLGFVVVGIWYLAGDLGEVVANPQYTAKFVLMQILFSLNTWSWLVFILGSGIKYLNVRHKTLDYAGEAVLPFYILHQTVILLIGFYIVQWNTGMLAKYFVISTTSFVVIMVIYDVCVRRTNPPRFLFGMRLRKKRGLTSGNATKISEAG